MKTRLDEFPVADISEEYLFLVQDPLTLEWCSAPLSDIKEYLQRVITREDVHVWSGPWEDYSAGVAGYALAASLGKDLLDRVVELEDAPAYRLPVATATRLGGIKVGSGLAITDDGVLSAGDVCYFEQDSDYSGEVHLKSAYAGLRIPGLRFGAGREAFDLEVRNVAAEGETPVYALYSPLPLITAGDQILGDGTPGGGGGGGAGYLHELQDVNISNPTNGQMLAYNATTQKWVNADPPAGRVQTVATVAPDANGDVPVADLKTALGLGSAAYQDTSYFAAASHTHSIGDVSGLNDNLSVISGALQTLQAQIDSVATRDRFDELLATALVADIASVSDLRAGRAHAERVYLADDVYFEAETVDGVVCVKLNSPLITTGDQILGSGGPSGGGGGGDISYLYELMDVDDALNAPAAGTLLQWYSNKWVGTAFTNVANGDLLTYASGRWTNVARTSVGIVTDATTQAHGLMSAADKSKLDGINTTYISHGETAYNDLTVVSGALQSLQAQIDSVASRDAFDELTANSVFADIMAASSFYGPLRGNADTATDADKLDGQHGSYYATSSAVSTLQGYFTNGVANYAANATYATSAASATNATYATYDSAGENISDKFGIISGALQSLQAQIDSVASRSDISDFEITAEAKMDYICQLMGSLQAQIDSVATRINDGSDGYFDILTVGKAIYGDVLITTGDQTLSDARRKKITREIVLSAEEIASCRAVAFDWTHQPGSSFGSIAQDWQKILPESVNEVGDVLYHFYSQSAEVAVINIAREVVKIKQILNIK